jgi:hypothetical protein
MMLQTANGGVVGEFSRLEIMCEGKEEQSRQKFGHIATADGTPKATRPSRRSCRKNAVLDNYR